MDSTLTQTRTFTAKCHNQILVMEPATALRDTNGIKYGETPGKRVEFENHIFVADEQTAARIGVPLDELIQWLLNHSSFNSVFWADDAPPDAESPTVQERTEEILTAFRNMDADGLNAIIEDERGTYNRGAVIQMAYGMLKDLAGEAEQE